MCVCVRDQFFKRGCPNGHRWEVAGADPGGVRGVRPNPPLAGESFCTTTPPVDKHQNELFFLPRPPVAICNSVHVYCYPRP